MLDIQPQQPQANQAPQNVPPKQTQAERVKAVGSKEGLTIFSTFAIICTAIVLIFTGLLFILRSSTEAQNKKKLDSVQKIKTDLDKPAYKELEAKLGDVKAQLVAIDQIQNQVDPTKVLDHLKTITPKNVKYTSFSVDSASEIKLEGYTTSYYNLAKYLVAVRSDAQLASSKLGSMNMTTKEGGAIEIRFSLSAKYVESAKPKTNQATSVQNGSRLTGTEGL